MSVARIPNAPEDDPCTPCTICHERMPATEMNKNGECVECVDHANRDGADGT